MVDRGGSLGNSAKLVLIKLLTCVYFNTLQHTHLTLFGSYENDYLII